MRWIALLTLTASALLIPQRAQAQANRDFPFLGVTTESIKKGDDKSGLRVTYVFPTSGAETIGLKAGDEIFAMNDILIESLTDFVRELRREKIGATLRFIVTRKGEAKKLKLKGKIGSYNKTMGHLQTTLRARMLRKELPKLPPIKWWDPKTKTFSDTFDLEGATKGKLTVLFGCNDFILTQKQLQAGNQIGNYRKFSQVVSTLTKQGLDLPVTYVGLYRDDRQAMKGEAEILAKAKAHFERLPPPFPVGVALFPDRMETVKRENLFFVRNQGVAILGVDKKVEYLQVLHRPELEFVTAFQKLLQPLLKKSN